MTKVLVVYYSMFGHLHLMAESVCKGARSVRGVQAKMRRVPETLDAAKLRRLDAIDAQKKMMHVPICTHEELAAADAVIFGTPTRFGNMCGQMREFLDATGPLWSRGDLVGKVGSVFTSASSQHGGLETTITSFHLTLLHHGMIIVGLPYRFEGQLRIDEVSGCSPYGASTITGPRGERWPSDNELAAAEFQGRHVARIAKALVSESA